MKSIIKNNIVTKTMVNLLPLKNTILLESIPNLSDNTKAVFDEMIRRKMNEKYEFVWVLNKPETNLSKIKNVKYIEKNDKRLIWYKLTSKCIICCNDFFVTNRKNQMSIYLSHGTPIKSLHEYYVVPDKIDYCLAAGNGIVDIDAYEFSYPKEKIVPLGFPRNDALTNNQINVKKLFPDVKCNKVFVWYPTYRQHKNGMSTCANALPIINDSEKAVKLNEFAKSVGALLILKPHFAQDVSYIKDLKLSNILFINDDFFEKNNITSYEFVGSCDALITDYSSIYYDYMLCDKPIALIWEDYEEYKKAPGFAKDVEQFLSGGEKVYTLEELQDFVKNVAEGKDNLRTERNKICQLANVSTDGENARRVVDFIVEKANL